MITDEDIIKLFTKDNEHINSSMLKKFTYLDNTILEYVKNRWNDIPTEYYTNKESIFRIIHKIEHRPVCLKCGKPVKYIGKDYLDIIGKTINGYRQHCCAKCSNTDENRIHKIQQTCLEKYGNTNVMKNHEIVNKVKQTCLKKYGVNHAMQNNEIANKVKQTCLEKYGVENQFLRIEIKDKIKQTCLEKYGVMFPTLCKLVKEKQKNTYIQLYGVEHPWKSDIIKDKIKQTCIKKYGTGNVTLSQYYIDICKKRNTFTYSKKEEQLYNILINIFSEHDIIRQYKSDVYLYKCDFYIKPFNLYIEYHGSMFHNFHKFDMNNSEDILQLSNILNKSDMHKNPNKNKYLMTIKTWIYYDILKYKLAEENKLNYLVVYPNIDFNILNKSFLKNIKGTIIIGENK